MFRNIIKIFLFAALACTATISNADRLGVRTTAGLWSAEYSGFVTDNGVVQDSIDLKDDLNVRKNIQSFFYIFIEQENSVIPNFRIGKTNIRAKGSNKLTKSLAFNGVNYSFNENVDSELNLDHIEATLYWKFINHSDLRVDLGFTLKDFSGGVALTGDVSGNAQTELSEIVPLLYLGIETDLPLTALTIGFNASLLQIEQGSLSDLLLFIRLEPFKYVGIEAGYRNFQINVDTNEIKTQVNISGLYLSGFLYF
ncbi:hypothetical protein MNBD_GAMMA22-1095 [hydrothermal vent metagenome]|uniref:TIGR04219 family outer membrane beta-barrel protein n=1 Tax=hydrothermal vent metagenome TaxID=652676 RepID=A0A3B1B4N7_9ZZZZ